MYQHLSLQNGLRGATARRWQLPRLSGTVLPLLLAMLCASGASALDAEDETGLWSMYFFSGNFGDSNWLVQGDLQYRQWQVGDDTEQILRRASVGYRPGGGRTVLAGGYAFITSKAFGNGGPENDEHRIYQEALIPQNVGERLYLTHRLRSEQRWVDRQDFRTRYRYALFANIPLNREDLAPGAVYLALYNELFINGERDTGRGRVDYFDRNRAYLGLGYTLRQGLRVQLGVMRQDTETLDRTQLQLGLHHNF
jgi:hypothetical protein